MKCEKSKKCDRKTLNCYVVICNEAVHIITTCKKDAEEYINKRLKVYPRHMEMTIWKSLKKW